jgi:P27 family predicted phage terminase small subunit
MRGGPRSNKPAALRAIQGSRTRPRHKREPKARPVELEAPRHLTELERTLWEYYAPRLAGVKVTTELDRETLTQFVEARAQVEDIKAQQADPDYRRVIISVVIDGAGNEKPKADTNPLDVQRRAWTQIARLCAAEIGLSPVSRARTSAPSEDSGDEFDDYLARRESMRAVKH